MTDNPQPERTAAVDRTALQDLIAEALRAAAFECDGKCGLSERDCYDAHPISFSAMSNGVTHVTGPVTAIAAAVLDVLPVPADPPASTAPLAAGFPLVQGRCPACGVAGLFLGSGGYVTCSSADCPEPDAATTVLEQYANEAHAPEHTWAAELHDPAADEWVPGTRYTVRDRAVNNLAHARTVGPTWRDGTPTQRRLVRATTTYTVEPHQPAAVAHPGKEA